MDWVGLALGAAFSESMKELCSKRVLQGVNPLFVALAASACSLPFLFAALFFMQGFPQLGSGFWFALVVGGGLNSWALVRFMKAIQASDLSVTVPFITFTPFFLLFTSPILVGEFPGGKGLIGIGFIVIGSYLLHIQEAWQGFLVPLRALFTEKGPKIMLSVALLWSITSNIDKIGVQNSCPLVWSFAINLVISIFLILIILKQPKPAIHEFKCRLAPFFLIGLFSAVTFICQMLAIDLASVPSVISIKRVSVLFSVVWGCYLLREGPIRGRLGGATLMVIGAALITAGEQ